MTYSPRRELSEPAATLRLDLARNPEAPAIARAAVTGMCEQRPLGKGSLARLRLLVSEVVSNAVIHPDDAADPEIWLRARLDDDSVRVEVTDGGRGFVPRPRDGSAAAPQLGGYGLHLLDHEAADWGVVQHDGTTVWFELDLRAP